MVEEGSVWWCKVEQGIALKLVRASEIKGNKLGLYLEKENLD